MRRGITLVIACVLVASLQAQVPIGVTPAAPILNLPSLPSVVAVNTDCLSQTTRDSYFQEVAANNPGAYTDGSNCANGTLRFDWNSTRVLFAVPIYLADGSAVAPSLAIGTDPTTGFYKRGTGTMGLSLSGQNLVSAGTSFFAVASGLTFQFSQSATDAAQGADLVLSRASAGHLLVNGNTSVQLASAQTTPPRCETGCGTPLAVVGSDSDMVVTISATGTPASPFVITLAGAFAGAGPSCVGQMAKAGMANTKLPLTITTTAGALTVTTNGAAPSNSDVYAIHCLGVQ